MNVCVYAISKNESKHVERFMRSCAGADGVYVLDTGSDDGTPARLRRLGAVVREEGVVPWRFDVARNRALELVPGDVDVCVSLDLDEVLVEGWRGTLEQAWAPGTTRLRYRYAWSQALTFWYDAVHARCGYRWRQPMHEALAVVVGAETWGRVDRVLVEHMPDAGRPRRDDLPLLRLGAAEAPDDPRAAYYLARELSFRERWQECVDEVERYLALPAAKWPEERSHACRLAAAATAKQGDRAAAARWLVRAAAEAPREREPWCELAALAARDGAHTVASGAAAQALALGERSWLHFNDPAAWGLRPHLLASAAARALRRPDEADRHAFAAERLAHERAARRPADWRALRELTAWAVEEGRLAAGAAGADRLLSLAGVPVLARTEARRAAAVFAAKLTDLVPGTEYVPLAFDLPGGWSLFNPTIAVDGDSYRAIVRSSNYTLSRGWYDLNGDDRVRTVNYDVRLDGRFEVADVAAIDDHTGRLVGRAPTVGYEDCRLFRCDGSWYVTATTLARDAGHRREIALLELEGSAFATATALAEPEQGRHSKNWMPVTAHPFTFVYSCAPTVIVTFERRSGRIERLARTPGPAIADGFRGSSQAVPVPGGHLLVVHEVAAVDGAARTYLHRFVLLDDSLTLTHVSRPFVFLHRGVEFCAGLAVHEDTAAISFGFRDAEAYVAAAPLDGVLATLRPVDEAGP